MAKSKLLLGILATAILLVGCTTDPTSSNEGSNISGSEPTVAELFQAEGYSEVTGWPTRTYKAMLSREDISEAWVDSNIPIFNTGSNATKFYVRNYEEEQDLIIYKSFQFALPTADTDLVTRYANQFKTTTWDTTFDEEIHAYSLTTNDGDDKVAIGLIYVAETELLPSAVYISITVRAKEEFVGAPRPSASAVRSVINFGNNYKITERNQDKVVWEFQGFSFTVEQDESAITVGNIPNNGGIGYLMAPLRVYQDQKVTFSINGDRRIEQLIIRTINYTEDGLEVISLAAFPDSLIDTAMFISETNILYHFTSEIHSLSLILTADARLSEIVAIYSNI